MEAGQSGTYPALSRISSRLVRLLLHGLLIFNFGLGAIYLVVWTIAAGQDLFWRADFSSYYTGWAIVRDGLGAQLYDFDLQARYQQTILNGRSFAEGLLPFVNPPGLVLLLFPLTFLSRSTAFWLWSAGQAALLTWLILLLLRLSTGWSRNERLLLLGAVLAFPPLLINFLLGAFSLLLLVCTLMIYLGLREARDGLAAIWLFVGAIKPQLIQFPGISIVGTRRWKALIWAGMAGLVMVVISSLFLGWRIWPDYLRTLERITHFFGIYGINPAAMYNFRGGLTTLIGKERAVLINQVSSLAFVCSFVLTVLLWIKWVPADQPFFPLRMALTTALGLFFGLHLHPQDGLLYVAPAFFFYMYLRQRDLPRRGFALFSLLCPFFFLLTEFNLGDCWGLRGPVLYVFILTAWIASAVLREIRGR